MAKQWYVIQAYSGSEMQVKRMLDERVALNNMQDYFGQIIVPSEEVYELRGGKKYRSDRKFFPGYVLVEMELSEHAWHLVRQTPKVLGFVGGSKERPIPISQKEADAILLRVDQDESVERPKEIFTEGEVVRIIDGPFSDFNGTVEQVNYAKSKLHLAVLIFGRATPVELDFNQVSKK